MRFPWQRYSQETLLPRISRGGREGQIICIERPLLPAGRSRINIRWLISFRPDQGVAFLKFSRQIVPSRGNRPFSPSPLRLLHVSPDPPCRLVALFPPAEVISTCRPDLLPYGESGYRGWDNWQKHSGNRWRAGYVVGNEKIRGQILRRLASKYHSIG